MRKISKSLSASSMMSVHVVVTDQSSSCVIPGIGSKGEIVYMLLLNENYLKV